MKRIRQILAAIGLLALLLCMVNVSAFAQDTNGSSQFPEGVIEVPQGTEVSIDDDAGTVTITNSPVDIKTGDTFVVYLQDLPIGYVANSVAKQDDCIIVSVEKADKGIYALLDEEGDIALTPDMYEFIPAPNVTYTQSAASGVVIGGDGLKYEDGTLSMTVSLGGSNATVSISDLHLSHSVSGGSIGLSLNGGWGISTTLSTSEDLLSDLPLGEIRIHGIGKIGFNLSFTQSASMKCNLSGTFSVGITATQDGDGTANKGFTVSNRSVEGEGSITASLKITAGVDVLVAAADLYVDIGAKTQYTSKTTFHEDTKDSTHCDDFKIYLFSTVGVEAKYYSPISGKMKPLASKKLAEVDASNSPFIIDIHFENGQLVSRCTQGMVVPDLHFGGFNASFTGTILTDNRERILETDVDLPWDMTIDQDLTLSCGNLNLNGKTLVIEGNLIQSGGTLTIGDGTLIVHGDYRIQSRYDGEYGDSDGSLIMTNSQGSVIIGGDFIVQTNSTSNKLTNGLIDLTGDFYQKKTAKENASFNSGSGLNLLLNSAQSHVIQFEDSEKNSIGRLTLDNEVTIDSSIRIGIMDNNGHDVVINGNLTSTQSLDMFDYNPMAEVEEQGNLVLKESATYQSVPLFKDIDLSGHSLTVNGDMISTGSVDLNGGVLTVKGNLYHWSGTILFNLGKLHIDGSYYSVGKDSCFEPGKESITNSEGYLKMVYAADEMRVGGNFIAKHYCNYSEMAAGTLYAAGDFKRSSETIPINSSDMGIDHKTVLNGTGQQIISFENSSYGFGTLEALNDQLVFEKNVNWLKQISDIHAVSNGAKLYKRDIDLNGHRLDIDGDIKIESNIDFKNGLLTINGNTEVGKDININNGQLIVNGSVNHRSGTIDLNGGKFYISGNYHSVGVDSCFEPGKESITNSEGYLKMIYAADEMRVGGNFIAKHYCNCSEMAAGTLYAAGDFKRSSETIPINSSDMGIDHKTVLNGTGQQIISFENSSYGFGTLEALNDQLVFEKNVNWLKQISDIHAVSNGAKLYKRDIDLNGHRLDIHGDIKIESNIDFKNGLLTINGNAEVVNDININNGQLTVNGSVNHRSGTINLNGGKLLISGNYHSVGKDSCFEPGKENITDSEGYLEMIYAADEMRVGGDFLVKTTYSSNKLTAGTLYVSGNFRQLNGYYTGKNFAPTVGHKTVLNGIGVKYISFESTSSRFGTLELCQPKDMYVFSPENCWLELIEMEPDIPNHGTMGDLNWSLSEEGILTIDGTGEMPDFSTQSSPWYASRERITGVILRDGVATIGSYAFQDCGSLTSITIPAGITSIGGDAFRSCTGLSSVTFEGDAPGINGYAFRDVTANAYYPAGNTSWTDDVMQNYGGNLTWIPWGEHVHAYTSVVTAPTCTEKGYTTYTCACEDSYVADFVDALGHSFVDGTCTVCGIIGGTCGENLSWELSDAVLTISGSGDMYNYSMNAKAPWHEYRNDIVSISIAQGAIGIGDFAFYECSSLNQIMIPYGVARIGHLAFQYCSSLTAISIPDSVNSIGDLAFGDCTVLASITIPSGITNISDYVFAHCSSLAKVTIPNSVTSIGIGAFDSCVSLTEITIPNRVTCIKNGTFAGCSGITQLTIPDSVIYIDDYAFANSGLTGITIPDRVTTIGVGAFSSCRNLAEISIPNSVTKIGEQAFCYSSLTSVTFNGTAPQIGNEAFYSVTANVYYPAEDETWNSSVMQNYGGNLTWISGGSHVHSYIGVTTAPTCTEKGYTTYTCDCGNYYVDDYVNALGHSETIVTGTSATCTEPGMTDGKVCKVCGVFTVKCEIIKALGHTEETISGKAPTCTETGLTEGKRCSVCGEVIVEQTIVDATGHTLVEEGYVAPTCTENGFIAKVSCSACGETIEENKVLPAAHQLVHKVSQKATLEEDGYRVECYVCSVCEACFLDENGEEEATDCVIPAVGTVRLSSTRYSYDGKTKTPKVGVYDSEGKKLERDKDYTVTYAKGRKKVGQYNVTMKGIGDYSFRTTLTFQIVPPKSSIKSLTGKAKSFTASWSKKTSQVTGYQLQYSLDKNFETGVKTVTIKDNDVTSKTIKSLKSKKYYYVRIRTYKTVSGENFYSGWSDALRVKTK